MKFRKCETFSYLTGVMALVAFFIASLSSSAEKLTYTPSARSLSESFLPKSPKPDRTMLIVLNSGSLSGDERAALWSLQGLTSREKPCIWISFDSSVEHDFLLQTMIESKSIERCEVVADWKTLFKQFGSSYKGAVVYDKNLYRSDTLAANIAGAEDLIATSPDVATELGIPIAVDLRGRFSTYADGLEWVWDRDSGKLNHRICDIARGIISSTAYSIEWRGIDIWPAGDVDGKEKGADPKREIKVVSKIFSQMEPSSAMFGYPNGGADGIGIGEGGGVDLASRYGISLIASDYMDNLPVLCGARINKLKQKRQPREPELEKDKIYVALAVSDGDNMCIWKWMRGAYFTTPHYGEFPLAFGMGPVILDLQPSVAQWYYKHAASNTEFISDVSGIAYMQPSLYGEKYDKPDAVLGEYLDWTSQYMKRMDMHSVRPISATDSMLAAYAAHIHSLDSLFSDMGRYSPDQKSGIENLTYTLPGASNTPIFRAATTWRYGKSGLLREIKEQVGQTRPAFVNAFAHLWTYDMGALHQAYADRDKDMVFVTPKQLAKLYQESKAKGWTK